METAGSHLRQAFAIHHIHHEKNPFPVPRRSLRGIRLNLLGRLLGILGIASLAAFVLNGTEAAAQAIIASINGDPITDLDVEERMKMLRILRKPATREAAMESLYTDRLEAHEAGRYGVHPKDADIGQEIVRVAEEMKIQPEALIGALQSAGVSPDHFKAHFGADLAFNALVGALNKGVEASETEVRKELAKQGGKAAAGTDYTLRQVIFTLPNKADPGTVNARGQEAEQLRQRFVDCESGEKMIFALNDVTIRDPIHRTSTELSDGLRNLLDKTAAGHLSPPQRSMQGIEMIAVCRKGAALDDTALRQQISQKILAQRLAADRARRLKEMRDRAVIVHH